MLSFSPGMMRAADQRAVRTRPTNKLRRGIPNMRNSRWLAARSARDRSRSWQSACGDDDDSGSDGAASADDGGDDGSSGDDGSGDDGSGDDGSGDDGSGDDGSGDDRR